jgi:hypothetical protein
MRNVGVHPAFFVAPFDQMAYDFRHNGLPRPALSRAAGFLFGELVLMLLQQASRHSLERVSSWDRWHPAGLCRCEALNFLSIGK